MKKLVLIYGLIAGLICGSMFFLMYAMSGGNLNSMMEYGMLIAYGSMIIAFGLCITLAVRQYRNKQSQGYVSFGKALAIGILISLIASSIYSASWEVFTAAYDINFKDAYMKKMKSEMLDQGMTLEEIDAKMKEDEAWWDLYANNIAVRMAFSALAEMFPVGLIISLIIALVFGVIMKPETDLQANENLDSQV